MSVVLDSAVNVAYDGEMGKTGGIFVRRLAVGLVVALLSCFIVFGGAPAAHAEGEGTILALVNQARAQNNLGPLRLNSSISAVSLAWANQMAANGTMTHNPSYSSQIPGGWTRAAENVAMGYGSPTAVHNGWMGSPGHRANILGDFTDIGIAFIFANGTTWAVENFAKYGASVPAPAPPAPPPAPAPAPVSPAPGPAPAPAVPAPAPSPTASPSAQPAAGDASDEVATEPKSSPSPSSSTTPAGRDTVPPVDAMVQGHVVPRRQGDIGSLVPLGALLGVGVLVSGIVVGFRLRGRWHGRAS